MRWALQPRWLLETALIQIAENKTGAAGEDAGQMEAIARKVAELESMVNRLGKKTTGGDAAGETAKRASSGVKTAAEKKNQPGRDQEYNKPGKQHKIK